MMSQHLTGANGANGDLVATGDANVSRATFQIWALHTYLGM
jgi:hypothetical protein